MCDLHLDQSMIQCAVRELSRFKTNVWYIDIPKKHMHSCFIERRRWLVKTLKTWRFNDTIIQFSLVPL